ncbi:ubiquinone-dependent pyruvate dehydrogenase [Agromyces intestinalis]|uniref:Pyruvate dehydrogenase [ubiquinone] n=1 Tax=Agromyces intestinalis TaxID=2592652 RepID=A0A5C1YA58_9MICO|nr:ubiquinone-dependent pyruvate dehydrogenase [Agromyces intestinalis]QEO13073.1 ubiquinone-dependent pyruvate dehydrogenase [Agromyces intestinalis]
MSYTVAELIVETLKSAGVRRVYGLPGDSLNGLSDALRRTRDLEWMHVRHEETAAFAAAAEAALTGELAVAAASCGPGNLHLVNGLFDAQRSRVPVLVVAAHIPSSEIGTGYFQETHPQELFRECSVFSELVSTPDQLPYVLDIAIRTAVEQRGVSVLVVPGDVLVAQVPRPRAFPAIRRSRSSVRPSDGELDVAAKALDAAERVTILAGAGCDGAHDELIALASRLQAPIVHSLRGKEFVEPDNPNDVGMTGLLGVASGYHAMQACDTLLIVGADFPYREFYPEHATVVQIDVRGEQIGRRTRVDIPLVGSAKETLAALSSRVRVETDSGHLDHARRDYASTRERLDRLAEADHDRTPLHPQFVARTIDEIAADDAVFIPDVGTPVIWAARYLRMNGRRRLIGSFTHGSMANAVPQAIGAQASQPGRQVVTLSGDGGLAMLLGDLITLEQMRLPVKVVVFNNGSLGFVELEMKAAGYVNFGTDLSNPSFAEVARALGMHGRRVEHPHELADALREAFAHDGSAVVEVMVARQELALPPSIRTSQVEGFALYATRSVLSGRADELIELVRTNITRRVFS